MNLGHSLLRFYWMTYYNKEIINVYKKFEGYFTHTHKTYTQNLCLLFIFYIFFPENQLVYD